jgi:hypothetical protein
VIHGDEAGRKRHEQLGFHQGSGKALDQLVAVIKNKQAVGTSRSPSGRVAVVVCQRRGSR